MTNLEKFKLNIFNEILNGKSPFDLIENIKNLKGFEKDIKFLALKFARYSEQFTEDERVKNCNDMTERYLNGEIIREELDAFWNTQNDAWTGVHSRQSDWYAAWDAWSAARQPLMGDFMVYRFYDLSTTFADIQSAQDDLGAIFVEWLRGLE